MVGQFAIDRFVAKWHGREGGQERANYALFLTEFCDALDIEHPDPAGATTHDNDYVFERSVLETARDGSISHRRIDLYRRDAFVLEAKQSRRPDGSKRTAGSSKPYPFEGEGKRRDQAGSNSWDGLMKNARTQAESYVRLLPVSHEPPPFIIVCDVGNCFEFYANFRRDGKAYDQFPDRQGFRIRLTDLYDTGTCDGIRAIWNDPMSLDPARKTAEVTRHIASRLASVSKVLEADGHAPEHVAIFLMRVLFTMFAEDVGLLPRNSFKNVLADCEARPESFVPALQVLWRDMDEGGFSGTLGAMIPRFNGEFFRQRQALPLRREEIGELRRAAESDWRVVEPAIFGTLLEQALEPSARRSLGAHYTPRAYVERIVVATVIEPLRTEWEAAKGAIEQFAGEMASLGPHDPARRRKLAEARAVALGFHGRLCRTRVLDPACGTGNFLYVALELMKRLEGEVIETIDSLEGQESLSWLDHESIGPRQFLGLEINPRAAAIAELVVWIGFLQWHFRTQGGPPPEPILHAYQNIRTRDAVLTWDGYPLPQVRSGVETYPGARQPEWPDAEFIIGNPPFIGGKDLRARLGSAKAEALWKAHPEMNESADYVMYWWDRAAELLARPGTPLQRFGFVTTNSIRQVFQRRVVERHLTARRPVSIIMAVPDHPWTKAASDSAAVRIAMTVVEAGTSDGVLWQVVSEAGLDTDAPMIGFRAGRGRIHSDLTIGVDVTAAVALQANAGMSSPGVKLHGSGFIVTPGQAAQLGLGRRPGLEKHIRPYRNGRDLTSRPREALVIDLFGKAEDDVRKDYPEVFQHLAISVRKAREAQLAKSATGDAEDYARLWWIFGKPRSELRPALEDLPRYIATVETAKHRVFQFLDAAILPDNMIVAIALDSGFHLGVLSSRAHVVWALGQGGTLEDRPRYSKSRCFDPFPFPVPDDFQRHRIGALAEELDAHRKRVLAEHPHLTLTGLYNVRERLRAGAAPADLTAAERRIFDDGLVLVLDELHQRLDAAVSRAYGWPEGLADAEILACLAGLNAERTAEERRGLVRWLRPEYQRPRFGMEREIVQSRVALDGVAEGTRAPTKPDFPVGTVEQTAAIMAALYRHDAAPDLAGLASAFRQGRRLEPRIGAILAALARTGVLSTGDNGHVHAANRFG